MISKEINRGSFVLNISTIKAMRRLKFSTAETYVYLYLLAKIYSIEGNIVEINASHISKELGLSRMQVIRVKQSLEKAKIIEFINRDSGNKYKINIIMAD